MIFLTPMSLFQVTGWLSLHTTSPHYYYKVVGVMGRGSFSLFGGGLHDLTVGLN